MENIKRRIYFKCLKRSTVQVMSERKGLYKFC